MAIKQNHPSQETATGLGPSRHPAEAHPTWAIRATELAESLLRAARVEQTDEEREQSERLARMMEDPKGKELTIALVDQAFRSHRPARIADQLSYLLDRYGPPDYMDWWERAGLTLGAVMGHYMPSLVVPPLIARLRQETRTVILPAEEEELRHYLRRRREHGVRLNLNLLGEAILGEGEAERRLQRYLEMLARNDVEYISVKISSVYSQINLAAYAWSLENIKERLRALYRQAKRYQYQHPDGRKTPKFINLDMEEYRDLHLTVDAFREVLDEPEFLEFPAGLALQAYLPDSYRIQQALTEWALARCRRGGAPIKIRIVKGANLAMEQVEAALRGWPQAPYTSKEEVDANYKRMVAYGCRPEHASAVHLGIGSHNLFDIAYALVLRDEHGVHNEVEFEMLEGMANHMARAVHHAAGGLLLYAPVVNREDFHSAIAYLVRRLDENTAPENFLHDLFGLQPESPAWQRQRDKFLAAAARQETVSDQPRRTQNRRTEEPERDIQPEFFNEPDTDWSLPANQTWVREIVECWQTRAVETVPLQIGGEFLLDTPRVDAIDPSRPDRVAYHHVLAGPEQIDRALDCAVSAQREWGQRTRAERSQILRRAAVEWARRRGDLIGAMMLDGAKNVYESDPEVSEAIDFARYYAQALEDEALWDRTRAEPLGVVVVTPPWNFPLAIPAGSVLAALMAGNAVLLKPAPETVLVAWHLVNALWEAGIPREVLQFVPAPDDEVGRMLITDARTSAVLLTGSIETARMFLEWRPNLRLFAETSGKNSLIVTSMADRDQAIKDLVRSAFGHNGQKCSAASLAILEGEVYGDPVFRRQLRDAVASLPAGRAWDLSSTITPLTQPPGEKLTRALTTLEPGEEWLLEPLPVEPTDTAEGKQHLWTPGIKLGVQPGSFFHMNECFGPVLGVMRARNLDEAIDLANAVPFGLTGGLHSLDKREIDRYVERIEVGNVYVNRHTTGAIVRRQPFGGWKASNVGSSAKTGGPNYVPQMAIWHQSALPQARTVPPASVKSYLQRCLDRIQDDTHRELLRASAESYAHAWQTHFGQEHDPSQVHGESNRFRYRVCDHLLLRVDRDGPHVQSAQIALAALTCGARLTISVAEEDGDLAWMAEEPAITVVREREEDLIRRLAGGSDTAQAPITKIRTPTSPSPALRAAANAALITVIDIPVLATGRLELRHYLREQAIAQTTHRYGNVMEAF